MRHKCPMCGTMGIVWNKKPEAFQCPNCFSIYSEFGMVMEIENELANLWS